MRTPKQKARRAALAAAPVADGTAVDSTSLRPLILVALCLSMMLFAVSAAPLRAVPWRRAAYFLSDRHRDMTLFGIALLVVAVLTMLLTKG